MLAELKAYLSDWTEELGQASLNISGLFSALAIAGSSERLSALKIIQVINYSMCALGVLFVCSFCFIFLWRD